MARISENMIPDINADWGRDASNDLPYSGEAVQEFIKRTFKQKFGYFHYDESQNKYLVFADENSKKLYDDSGDPGLILGTFDAPAAYTIEVDLQSGVYNSVLSKSTGNLLRFKFVTKKQTADVPEAYKCLITFVNGGVKKSVPMYYQPEEGMKGVTLNIDNYLLDGTNTITISLKGETSSASTTVTAIYNVINLNLKDNLDISKVYNPGDNLAIPVTVSGSGTKILEWWVDGIKQDFDKDYDRITSPGETSIMKIISLKDFTPGLHSVQYRVYTESNGQQFNSTTLFRNFFVSGGNDPLFGVAVELPIGDEYVESGTMLSTLYGIIQYIPYNIRFAIYDPEARSDNNIDVFVKNKLYTSISAVNGAEEQLSIILNDCGDANLQFRLHDTVYGVNTTVEASSINVEEIPTDVLNLRAFGRNNNANQDVWTYTNKSGHTITSSFEGFYWNSQSGWNNNSLIINKGAKLTINYAPLSTDWTRSLLGATFEFEFATKNIQNENTPILSLLGDGGQGIIITASEAKMVGSGENQMVSTKFKSGTNNRITFVINPIENVANKNLLFIYVNGIICGAINYKEGDTVRSESKMIFGGDADIVLKHILFYDKALTAAQILNNYILYRDEISEMLDVYTRNDIRNAQNDIDPEKIKKYLPVMYFTCLGDENSNIPWLESQNESKAKDYKIFCDIEYVDLADETRNFKIKNSRVRLQGTSSIQYPKKNWRFYTAKDKNTVYIDYLGNEYFAPANKNEPDLRKYAIRPNSIPVDCWCLKTDYAESSGAHNSGTAKFWNNLLTSAVVTYTNVNKSEHYMLWGVREDGIPVAMYTFWDEENASMDKSAILESNFVSYYYEACSRQDIINTGLISKAVTVKNVPEDLTEDSDLFVIKAYEHGVVNEKALMTNAQQSAIDNNYNLDVRTAIDGFPIVVFYRLDENSDWIFLGKHNFNNDKSTEAVFGFKDIPGFDNKKMQCWELTNNNSPLGFFSTVEGWFDTKVVDEKTIIGWEDAFEARYPDDGSDANTNDLYAFSEWISKCYSEKLSTGKCDRFDSEKWQHFDVYKMASYYIYLMRFGAVDQVVKNSMFTSEDGKKFYFIIYDNDTILGVRNDGRLIFDPTIDRQSIDTQAGGYAYAGHESAIWNMLEDNEEFMDIVKAVDKALYTAGLRYDNAIKAYEDEQTSKWCEWIYNEDAELKYIGPFKKGFGIDADGNKVTSYSAGLLSLQGNRNSHRRWWLSQRFNLYDAKFVTGTFKENNIFLKMQNAPAKLPFTITSAAKVYHGYEITNGSTEISNLVEIDGTHTFTIPQAVSIGDPVVIFGATNIKKLDLSALMPYMTEISFSKAHSETLGSAIEELDMSGVYENEGDLKISGLEGMTALKKLNLTGMRSVSSLALPNSYNLKELLADGTSISSVELAPGCVIETLELPNTINRLALKELPLLASSGLKLADWKNVREIEIDNCPNLANDFNLIWNWYQATKDVKYRRLTISGTNWRNVDINQLIELIKNVTVVFSGNKNEIVLSPITDKQNLLRLENLFPGVSIFNKESYLYIHSIDQVFTFGPESQTVFEGGKYEYKTIDFIEADHTVSYYLSSDVVRDGTKISNEGLFTTVENGQEDEMVFVSVLCYTTSGIRYTNDEAVTVKKRIYPEKISIVGETKISKEIGELHEFTWRSENEEDTGDYVIEWSLNGDVQTYLNVVKSNNTKFVVEIKAIPDNLATGELSIKVIRNVDKKVMTSNVIVISIANPNIIMTFETNPHVLSKLYSISNGRMESDQYLLKSEAVLFETSDFTWGLDSSLFKGDTKITSFDEFKYFTNVTSVGVYFFRDTALSSITLPETITSIERDAFYNCNIKTITIPNSVTYIHQTAFHECKQLKSIEFKTNVKYFNQNDGCVYTGNNTSAELYTIPPGLTEYVMPDNVYSVKNGDYVFQGAKFLNSIVFNNKVTQISGEWFKFGMRNLTTIVIPEEHPLYAIYNGCIYDKEFKTLIYWPSIECRSDLLHENTTVFANCAFVANGTIGDFVIPNRITHIGDWCFYNAATTSINLPVSVESVGALCFGNNTNLEHIDIDPNCKLTIMSNTMFKGCNWLKQIIVPINIIRINEECFDGCRSLEKITCFPSTAPSLTEKSFPNDIGKYAENKTLLVPKDSVGYDSGYWQTILQDEAGFVLSKTL